MKWKVSFENSEMKIIKWNENIAPVRSCISEITNKFVGNGEYFYNDVKFVRLLWQLLYDGRNFVELW